MMWLKKKKYVCKGQILSMLENTKEETIYATKIILIKLCIYFLI